MKKLCLAGLLLLTVPACGKKQSGPEEKHSDSNREQILNQTDGCSVVSTPRCVISGGKDGCLAYNLEENTVCKK